jgi:hypothetical protein
MFLEQAKRCLADPRWTKQWLARADYSWMQRAGTQISRISCQAENIMSKAISLLHTRSNVCVFLFSDAVYCQDVWKINEWVWNIRWMKYSEEILFQCHKRHMDWPVTVPGPSRWKAGGNRLSHGTAQATFLFTKLSHRTAQATFLFTKLSHGPGHLPVHKAEPRPRPPSCSQSCNYVEPRLMIAYWSIKRSGCHNK